MKTPASTKAHQPRAARRQSQEADILTWIMHAPQTLTTLSQLTGLAKNTISGRLSDLQAKGIVTGFETAPEVTGRGVMLNVTVYQFEPDEAKQAANAYNRRRTLDIRAIEGCLNRHSEVYPQSLVANMRAFLDAQKAAGHLHSDYQQPQAHRPPDKFTNV